MSLRELYGRCHRIDWHLYAAAVLFALLGLVLVHRGQFENGWALLILAWKTFRQAKFDRKLGRYIPRVDPSRPHGIPPALKEAATQPETLGTAAVVVPDHESLPPVEEAKA